VGEERLDVGGPELDRVAVVVELDEPAGPVDVRVLGTQGIVADPEGGPHLVKQSGSAGGPVGFGPGNRGIGQVAVEEVAIQEQEGATGLGQPGERFATVGQVGEEGSHFGLGHLVRVSEVVEADEGRGPPDPGRGLGGRDAAEMEGSTKAVEESGRVRGRGVGRGMHRSTP
jgi:hypothetical protein